VRGQETAPFSEFYDIQPEKIRFFKDLVAKFTGQPEHRRRPFKKSCRAKARSRGFFNDGAGNSPGKQEYHLKTMS
jgi:hypothetical protein